MKQIIFLSFLICLASNVIAQTEKGNYLIGGSASFQASKNGDTNSKSLSLSPNISYFLANRFAVGIITPLSISDNTAPSSSLSSKSYSIGPTVRYYFPISEQWAIFPQLDYTYQWTELRIDQFNLGPGDLKSTATVFRINMGITYFITRNVGLESILYYQNTNADPSAGGSLTSGTAYGLRFGLQIYLLGSGGESGK
jgi:hypothetical protein